MWSEIAGVSGGAVPPAFSWGEMEFRSQRACHQLVAPATLIGIGEGSVHADPFPPAAVGRDLAIPPSVERRRRPAPSVPPAPVGRCQSRPDPEPACLEATPHQATFELSSTAAVQLSSAPSAQVRNRVWRRRSSQPRAHKRQQQRNRTDRGSSLLLISGFVLCCPALSSSSCTSCSVLRQRPPRALDTCSDWCFREGC